MTAWHSPIFGLFVSSVKSGWKSVVQESDSFIRELICSMSPPYEWDKNSNTWYVYQSQLRISHFRRLAGVVAIL